MVAGSAGSAIDQGKIVSEAIALIREKGMDGLTMRALAVRLNVRAPSLYWHFPDKAALVRRMVGTLFEQTLNNVPAQDDWRQWMRAFGRAIWKTHQETKYAPMMILSADLTDERMEDVARLITARLKEVPGMPPDAFELQAAIQAHILGWSVFAQSDRSGQLNRRLPFEKNVMHSLDSLINGWKV